MHTSLGNSSSNDVKVEILTHLIPWDIKCFNQVSIGLHLKRTVDRFYAWHFQVADLWTCGKVRIWSAGISPVFSGDVSSTSSKTANPLFPPISWYAAWLLWSTNNVVFLPFNIQWLTQGPTREDSIKRTRKVSGPSQELKWRPYTIQCLQDTSSIAGIPVGCIQGLPLWP